MISRSGKLVTFEEFRKTGATACIVAFIFVYFRGYHKALRGLSEYKEKVTLLHLFIHCDLCRDSLFLALGCRPRDFLLLEKFLRKIKLFVPCCCAFDSFVEVPVPISVIQSRVVSCWMSSCCYTAEREGEYVSFKGSQFVYSYFV